MVLISYKPLKHSTEGDGEQIGNISSQEEGQWVMNSESDRQEYSPLIWLTSASMLLQLPESVKFVLSPAYLQHHVAPTARLSCVAVT